MLALLILVMVSTLPAQIDEAEGYGALDAAGELGLGRFQEALEMAGMADMLDNRGVLILQEGKFAVFAPTDEAFANMTEMDNRTELRRVLSYHIVWKEGPFEGLSGISSLRSLEGENLTVEDGQSVNGARIIGSRDYENGTIYAIDGILMPERGSPMGAADAARALGAEKFASALGSEGLADSLSGQGVLGIEALSGGPFTIFAPTDEAFSSAKTALDSIGKKEGGMRALLSYHIIDSRSLLNMTSQGSIKTLQGESLAVDTAAGLVGGARVLGAIRYENGIVYSVDQVLIPVGLSI
ncbi:MAG: fasciclin domain-containing protein [Methanothrix sp.]|nr:fasciclin domain-containing protein [Methanothrix sp.]